MLVHRTYTCRVWNTLGCLQDSSDTWMYARPRWLEVSLLYLADFLPGFFSHSNSLCPEDFLCYRISLRTARNFSLSGHNLDEFLFFIQGGIWNLDHLLTCGIPYANTDGIPRNSAEFRAFLLQKIPRNSAKFRGIPYVFQKIPCSVGSQKRTSVDTLLTRLPQKEFCMLYRRIFRISNCLIETSIEFSQVNI
jgi:hypothetical protein